MCKLTGLEIIIFAVCNLVSIILSFYIGYRFGFHECVKKVMKFINNY